MTLMYGRYPVLSSVKEIYDCLSLGELMISLRVLETIFLMQGYTN